MEITHDEHKHMFEIREDGQIALLEYKSYEGGINIVHTFVPKSLQHRGMGTALVKHALDYARANKLKVIIGCPFARIYVARHKQYEDLL